MDAKVSKTAGRDEFRDPGESGERLPPAGAGAQDVSPRVTILNIEERGRRLNLSLSKLCDLAGVYPGTVLRWRAGTNAPGLAMYVQTLRALEAALEKERLRLRLATATGVEGSRTSVEIALARHAARDVLGERS